jgi:hypothetical protein
MIQDSYRAPCKFNNSEINEGSAHKTHFLCNSQRNAVARPEEIPSVTSTLRNSFRKEKLQEKLQGKYKTTF